jgi:peptidoglycan hydrolase CwlO-like protein
MKKIKDNIVYILLGFTLVISIYSTTQIILLDDLLYKKSDKSDNDLINNKVISNSNEITDLRRVVINFDNEIKNSNTYIYENQMRIDDNKRNVSDLEDEVSDLKNELKELKMTLSMSLGILLN